MPFESKASTNRSVSVSTQANLIHNATTYESEDENTGRRRNKPNEDRRIPTYSKQEFREQYCINPKQLDLFELERSKKEKFLGCLSHYHLDSPCTRANSSSFLSVCVRGRVPSDENLNMDYAPIQRYSRSTYPMAPPAELYAYDEDLESSYFRRRPRSVCSQPDPKRFTWMPEDEEFTRMEWPKSMMMNDNRQWQPNYRVDQISSMARGGSLPRSFIPCPAHAPLPPPPPPPAPIASHRTKHVSFARSHTLTTFDDTSMLHQTPATGRVYRPSPSSERLIDGRLKPELYPQFIVQPFPQHVAFLPPAPVHYPPVVTQPMSSAIMAQPPSIQPQVNQDTAQAKVVVLDSIKKGVMRSQATQTEVCLGRKPLPPKYLSLSPRTIKRVKMVAAGVQTNGFAVGTRRLTKSFSEVGGDRLVSSDVIDDMCCRVPCDNQTHEHEKLQRTQSEEPPRSPRTTSALSSPVTFHTDPELKDTCDTESPAFFKRQQEYFHQNFQFIHESDRDDTIDDDDLDLIEKSMALNRKNLEYLQKKISETEKTILSKTISDTSQKTINSTYKTSIFQSENSTETSVTTTDDSAANEKEIMINFEPKPDEEAIIISRKLQKRQLMKTMSDGAILLDGRKVELSKIENADRAVVMSISQDNLTKEEMTRETKHQQYAKDHTTTRTPIKDEGIFSLKSIESFSSSDGNGNAPSEDFHEKYIMYNKHEVFRKRSVSLEESNDSVEHYDQALSECIAKSSPASPDSSKTTDCITAESNKNLLVSNRLSPFASNDSLTTDNTRDHSDGIWNESQATVLHVDSGAENGTVMSSSDLSSLTLSPSALTLLTPTSRRKHLLLLQHQQRSSMDTDALEEELDASQSQSPTSPRSKADVQSLPLPKQPINPVTLSPMEYKTQVAKPAPSIAITHPSLDLTDVPAKRISSTITKKRERALSPSRRKDLRRKNDDTSTYTVESDVCKTDDIELARTDSGKTNTTDMSESTTDDYVTASSRTQSQVPDANKAHEGSSFESASSLYSLTKAEGLTEELVASCYSPPLDTKTQEYKVPNLTSPYASETVKQISEHRIEVTAEIVQPPSNLRRDNTKTEHKDSKIIAKSSDFKEPSSYKSSSSGSYSINDTKVNIETKAEKRMSIDVTSDDKTEVTIDSSKTSAKVERRIKLKCSISDDERSGHYSSSGYYESPVEDYEQDDGGLTYKHSQKYRSSNRPWSTEEKRRKKKAFTLEFSKSYDDSISTSQDDWSKNSNTIEPSCSYKSDRRMFDKDKIVKTTRFKEKSRSVQSSPREAVEIEKSIKEKAKRLKIKNKSSLKGSNGEFRTTNYDNGQKRSNDIGCMKSRLNIPTSDDSSEQYHRERDVCTNGATSPRRHRRLRDSPRRKTTCVVASNQKSPTTNICYGNHRSKKKTSNDTISLPGSLQRRKQSLPLAGLSSLEAEDIESVEASISHQGTRLTPIRYIKSPIPSLRHFRSKQGRGAKFGKAVSAESLRSVSPGSDSVFYSEQQDSGGTQGVNSTSGLVDAEACTHCQHCGKEVHIVTASNEAGQSHTDESYTEGTPDIVPAPAGFADIPNAGKTRGGQRLYKKLEKRYRSEDKSRQHRHKQEIRAKSEERGKEEYKGERRETRIARSAGTSLDKLAGSSVSVDPEDDDEEISFSSEGAKNDERGVYAAPWWCGNWILLPANEDLWKSKHDENGITDKRSEDSTESEVEFAKRYIALTHRLVHRRACIDMFRRQNEDTFESDKTVIVRRGNDEFGFRIHGSKPVVVSAIEPDTPAETSGLEVGDIVIAVNGINVLDKSHSEVVKIAHAGSEVLELEVARTCDVVASLASESGKVALFCGYLWRAVPGPRGLKWTRRWFCLKRDNCLYYYKTDASTHPVGALMLVNYNVSAEDAGKPYGFRVWRGGGARLQLAADNQEAANRWKTVIARAAAAASQRDGWLEMSMRNMKTSAGSIQTPDCFGYLTKLGNKWKSWNKRYCVLKDACLYFYQDATSKNAFGMACLHGYRVNSCCPGGKKYAFEISPTEPKQRHFYFHTESEMDKKRWIAALEYSIDRWMKAD